MNGDLGADQLVAAHRALAHCWEFTADRWNDSARHHFEKTYIGPLQQDADAVAGSALELTDVLVRARHWLAGLPS